MNENWIKIYESNKEIDDIFIARYQNTEDYFKKNVIEFLVELGEFVNETKCFKYWTIKKPDKEKSLEELADAITMILLFYHLLDLEIAITEHTTDTNPLDVIHFLYQKGTELMNHCVSEVVITIFSNLLYLGELFGYQEQEIIEAILLKQKITIERLASDY